MDELFKLGLRSLHHFRVTVPHITHCNTGQEIKVDAACCIRFLEVNEPLAFNSFSPVLGGCSLIPEGVDLNSLIQKQKEEQPKQDK